MWNGDDGFEVIGDSVDALLTLVLGIHDVDEIGRESVCRVTEADQALANL